MTNFVKGSAREVDKFVTQIVFDGLSQFVLGRGCDHLHDRSGHHRCAIIHDRTRSRMRAQTRQGKSTSGSALLRLRNSASYSFNRASSVVKQAPFFRLFTSATIGASSRPNK